MGKGPCSHARWLEFNHHDPHCTRRELSPKVVLRPPQVCHDMCPTSQLNKSLSAKENTLKEKPHCGLIFHILPPFPPSPELYLIDPIFSLAQKLWPSSRGRSCVHPERGVPVLWPLRHKELTGSSPTHLPSRGSWLPRGSWISRPPSRNLKAEWIHFTITFWTTCERFKCKPKILTLF